MRALGTPTGAVHFMNNAHHSHSEFTNTTIVCLCLSVFRLEWQTNYLHNNEGHNVWH